MLPDSLSLENVYKAVIILSSFHNRCSYQPLLQFNNSVQKTSRLMMQAKMHTWQEMFFYALQPYWDWIHKVDMCIPLWFVELSHLDNFWNSDLPQDFVKNSLVKVPAQFQAEMNTVNMYTIPYGLPLREDLYEQRQKELQETSMSTVLLASEFPLVGMVDRIESRKQRQSIGWTASVMCWLEMRNYKSYGLMIHIVCWSSLHQIHVKLDTNYGNKERVRMRRTNND